jgi:hypothetical protein
MKNKEEAALKLYPDDWDRRERLAFIEGANWQAERKIMTKEEEIEKIAMNIHIKLRDTIKPIIENNENVSYQDTMNTLLIMELANLYYHIGIKNYDRKSD